MAGAPAAAKAHLDLDDLAGLDLTSFRVVEVTATDAVVDLSVPSQLNVVAGRVEITLDLETGTGAGRYFHVYFGGTGDGATGSTWTDRVRVVETFDEGRPGYQVNTPVGQWFLDAGGGGFSSLVDAEGNDWIGWNTAPASAGMHRGIPNMVFPGNVFHPGFDTATTKRVLDGPVRAIFTSSSTDKTWRVRYEFLTDRLIMTVEAAPGNYWVLYEGTPGGALDADDLIIRPGESAIDGTDSFLGDVDPEWIAVADPAVDRALLMGAPEDDGALDSYAAFPAMTVLGFGRNGTTSLLSGVDRSFVFGLRETADVATINSYAPGLLEPVSVSVGPVVRY